MTVPPCRFATRAPLAAGWLLAAALLAAPPLMAAEPAGRVITTVGVVTATDADDNDRPLTRNDVVYPGERIETGPRGRIQIRFKDDGLIDLKPETAFEIEQYREAEAEDEGGSVVFNFLRGALRTITGAIGSAVDDEYTMNTPVATIGVRGTDYVLHYCGDAGAAGPGCGEDVPPGLYGRVNGDQVIARNAAGSGTFGANQYFLIPPDAEPRVLLVPPPGILDGTEDALARVSGEAAEQAGQIVRRIRAAFRQAGRSISIREAQALLAQYRDAFEAAEQTFEDEDDIDPGGIEPGGGATSECCLAFTSKGSQGPAVLPGITSVVPTAEGNTSGEYTLDEDGIPRLIGFADNASGEQFGLDFRETPVAETGTTLGSKWGVLAGGWDLVIDDGSNVRTEALDAGGLAYTRPLDLTTPTEFAALSGFLSYTPAGGPDAIDSFGNRWAVTQLSIGVLFDSQVADLVEFQLDEIGGAGASVRLGQATALTLDPNINGVAAVFNETPILATYEDGGNAGTAEVDIVGIFTKPDGTAMPVAFDAGLIDEATGLPLREVGGVQVLEGQPLQIE
jgi:hypothetical protein